MKKQLWKKGIPLLILAAMVTAVGCGKGTEELVPKEGTNAAKTEGEKTKIVFLRAGTEPERKAHWEKIIAGFEAANPDIDIEYQECPYGNDMETKLNTGFASGTAPDVINFTMASMGTRVPLGQYAQLDSYMENWDGKEDMMENVLSLGSVGDKVYGIGVLADPRILIYNKELFEKAGLDPEAPPTTWEEFKEYHEKLTIKDAEGNITQVGFGLPTSGTNLQHFFSIFIEQNGVKNLVDEVDNTILLNTAEAVEAAAFMQEIAEIGNLPWDSSKSDQNPFMSGRAAMTIGSDTEFKNFSSGEMQGKIAMASPLTNKKQATFCGMNFMFMSGETKHSEEAWKFIEYVSSAESMWTRYEDLGGAPLRNSLKEKYIAENPESNKVVLDSINTGTGSPKVPYANSVYNITNEAIEKILFHVATPEEALAAAAQKLQEEIDNQ